MTRTLFLLVVCLAGATLGCGASDQYRSKFGNYTCTHLVKPGERVREAGVAENSILSFSDQTGKLLRIESFKIRSEDQDHFEGSSVRRTLDDLFDRVLMPEEYLKASPRAKVLRRDRVTGQVGEMLFLVVYVPEGSTVQPENGGPRSDSLRGVMLLPQRGFLYAISNQLWNAPANTAGATLDEQAATLKRDLTDDIAGMTFR